MHFEIPVSSVQNFALGGADEDASACFDCCEFVEEIQEHHFFERNTAESGQGIDFCYEIFVMELIFGVPLYSIIESFGNGEQIKELNEAMKGRVEISDDGSPPYNGWIVNLHFISEWCVAVDGSCSRYDCGGG